MKRKLLQKPVPQETTIHKHPQTPRGASGWGFEAEMMDIKSETQFLKEVIELSKTRSRKRLYS